MEERFEILRYCFQVTISSTNTGYALGNLDNTIPIGFIPIPQTFSNKRLRGIRSEGGFVFDKSVSEDIIATVSGIKVGLTLLSLGGQNSDVIATPLPTYFVQQRTEGNKNVYINSTVVDFAIVDVNGVNQIDIRELYYTLNAVTGAPAIAIGDVLTFNLYLAFSD